MKRFSFILSLVLVLSMVVGLPIARADYIGCGYDCDVRMTFKIDWVEESPVGSGIWVLKHSGNTINGDAYANIAYTAPGSGLGHGIVIYTSNDEEGNPDPSKLIALQCETGLGEGVLGAASYNPNKVTTEIGHFLVNCGMWLPNTDGNRVYVEGGGELIYSLVEKTNKGNAQLKFALGGKGVIIWGKGSFQFVDGCPGPPPPPPPVP